MAGNKLTWAFDCDDVVVPTASVLIDAYNERYNTDVGLDAFYNDENTWGAGSHAEAIQRVGLLLREGVTANARPSKETIEALSYLATMDELHMVTGRQDYLEESTHAMLTTYLPGVFSTVEHTNFYRDAGSTAISRTKGEVCAAIGADILVDDHVVHGASVLESGLKEVIVWGDYPWNRASTLVTGMVRCATWNEVFRERSRILATR